MAEVRIKPLKNGPLEVSGQVVIVDQTGDAKPADEDPIYLCRCGQSANKPFCDGSHTKAGFKA
jgi:CDGSH-type Zn-finger protein